MPHSFEDISFRFFFDASPDAMLVVDSCGRIVLSNRPAQELLGYSEHELGKLDVEALILHRHRERHSNHRLLFQQASANRAMDSAIGFYTLASDGAELPVNISLCQLGLNAETLTLVTFHFNEAENRFRQLAENIGGVFWLTSPDKLEVLYISPGYERIWGRARESLLTCPTSWADAIHPEDRERVITASTTLQISGDYDVEYRIMKPDGGIRWVRDRAFPVKTRSGQVYRIAGIAEDITDSKRAHIELLESEARLNQSQRIAKLGSWELDLRTNHLVWSDEVFRIFEIDKARFDASYAAFLQAIHPDDVDMVSHAYRRHLAELTPYDITHRLLMPDGRIKYVAEQCWSEFDSFGNPLYSVGTVQDITEWKRMQRELIRQRNELYELQKRQIATQTISAIAHELNQPLFAIAAYTGAALRMLKSGNPDMGKFGSILDACEQQAQRAGRSIREMLDFLNNDTPSSEAFNLNQLILDAVSVVKSDHDAAFKSILNLDAALPNVHANRTHVHKVLINLFQNGIEAMISAGISAPSVTVRTAMVDTGMARVTIQDNGPGLNAGDAKRIFGPFYTTKTDGMGMGLAISRSLIEAQYGELWIDLADQGGAMFHFTLPLAQ